jgi:3-oxoadipate enol-lactonase
VIYHESHGEGAAIVFAHGVAGNHASWFQQVPTFSRSYRVVTFDHRGFGRSTDPDGLGRSGFVEDLKTLLDELEIDKACLVGQSMGGGTVVGFAGRYPERVSALVMSDSLFGIDLPESIRAGFEQARDDAAGLGRLERVLGKTFRDAEPAKTHLYQALASFNATDRDSLPGSWGRLYTPDELKSLGVPILFAVGEHDVLVPAKLVHELSAMIPGSFAVEFSDSGHSPYFECPTEFNDSVVSFMQAAGVKGSDANNALSNTSGYKKVED